MGKHDIDYRVELKEQCMQITATCRLCKSSVMRELSPAALHRVVVENDARTRLGISNAFDALSCEVIK